jgi:type IV fimbrial biogenesis protein FimT
VVMAVTAILATLAVPLMTGAPQRRAFEGIAAELATDLRYARTEAVARHRAVAVSFEADAINSCYVVHTGSATACHCLAGAFGDPSTCAPGASDIKTVRIPVSGGTQLQSNVASIGFSPITGSAAPFATITLAGPHSTQIRHIVSLTGRVRSCIQPPPSESFAVAPSLGYRIC